MEGATYTVQLENFAGPLDLLLQLIQRQKLDICDISLAVVTQDYIASIQDMVVDPHQANWFLDIASRLILYKSRALLPNSNEPEDEPLEDLTEQLQALASIRQASIRLLEKSKQPFYGRKNPKSSAKSIQITNLNKQTLQAAYPKKIHTSSEVVAFKLKRQNPIHLRAKLQAMLANAKKIEIKNLGQYCSDNYETVVCFLLTLELIKDNKAVVTKRNNSMMVELL